MTNPGSRLFTTRLRNHTRLITALTTFCLLTFLLGATAFMQTRRSPVKAHAGQAVPLVGPVTVTATAGTVGPTDYATLKLAFDAINAGTHQGAITIDINGDTVETASAVLNNSGAGAAVYTSVSITPSGGPRTVTGSIVGAVIKLNGADNVTIDGRISGSGRNLTVSNSNTSTATAAIWLASVVAGNGASNNVIRNLEIAAGATSNTTTNSTFGIIMCGTTISTTANGDDNDNNSFIANRIIRARYGIVTRGVTTNLNIAPIVTDNIIGPASFGADEIGKTGILMQADTGAIVSRNTIQFVGGDLANTTSGADRLGIALGSEAWSATASTTLTSNTYTVTKNIIHDIVEERTFSAVGIESATTGGGSATNNLIANNFIYNVRADGTSGDQVVGIGIVGGHTDKVVYNSISITGDMDPGAASSSTTYGNGIRIPNLNGATHANLTLMDNIIYIDANSNTAANHYYAITANAASYSFGTGGENYNDYYINPSNAQLRTGGLGTATGNAETTEFLTLANWKTAFTAPQDANSVQGDPHFISPTADLHINTVTSTIVESAGTPITGVTDDIDMDVRNATTPDIGADEFAGTPLPANDIAATAIITPAPGSTVLNGATVSPQASFTNVGTATQNNVMVQFTITGPGGYSYTDNQTIATITPGQTVTVTFAAAPTFTMNGAYNMAALVTTPDANSANDSVAGSFTVASPLNGTYTVGTGGNFTSLTNPGGLFAALNGTGTTGNVVANITSDLTSETGAVALNQFTGGFSVTIQPSGGAARLISGGNATVLINLNGADKVAFNGLNTGGNSLTIRNTNNAGATFQITNDASMNSILNSTVEGGCNNASAGVIAILTGPTTGNDNNTISGNTIRDRTDAAGVPANLVVSLNGSLTATNSNNVISNNQMRNFTANGFASSIAVSSDNWSITGNEFSQTATRATTIFAINIGGCSGTNLISQNLIHDLNTSSTFTALGILIGDSRNLTISRNRIYNFVNVAGATGTIEGIEFDGASGTVASVTVVNNMVSLVPSVTTAQVVIGIQDFGFGGNTFNAFYNSIYVGGTASGAASSWALRRGTLAPTTYTAKDNIAFNNRTGGTGSHFAGGDQSTNTGTFVSDFNFYAGTGATPANFMDKGTSSTGTPVSYASWQAGPPARDANSTGAIASTFNPNNIFVNQDGGDLHLKPTAPAQILNAGMPVAGVTTDFDNDTRDATTPDIGADEFVASLAIADQSNVEGDSGTHNVSVTVTLNAASNQTVMANWATAPGTATANVDYTTSSGTVTFTAGQTTQTIDVPIISDIIDEGNETFFVNLTMPSNAGIADSQAIVTIIDDDLNTSNFDLDASPSDGKDDFAVFRPSAFRPGESPDGGGNAVWYILNSNDGSVTQQQFGASTDIPVAGDYNGDGKKEIAVWRPSEGAWYISHGSAQNFARIEWGLSTDIPVPGDYDGDTKTDIAVFRPSDGTWYIQRSSDGGLQTGVWGNYATDNLAPSDYDGDGKTDLAVFRTTDGTWYIKRSSDGSLMTQQWGLSNDMIVPADYDRDGKTDIAVWRPSNGTFYVLRSSDAALQVQEWGLMGDIPVVADYDNDGKADFAVWRPSVGTYFIIRSSDGGITKPQLGPVRGMDGVQWGQAGDKPVRYVPEQHL